MKICLPTNDNLGLAERFAVVDSVSGADALTVEEALAELAGVSLIEVTEVTEVTEVECCGGGDHHGEAHGHQHGHDCGCSSAAGEAEAGGLLRSPLIARGVVGHHGLRYRPEDINRRRVLKRIADWSLS